LVVVVLTFLVVLVLVIAVGMVSIIVDMRLCLIRNGLREASLGFDWGS
jgi:hypothetical protein